MKKANHLCERCLAKGLYEPAKIVHHKIYLTEETMTPELMYGFDNLEALCLACHNDEHGRSKPNRRWKFVDGELVTMEIPPSENTKMAHRVKHRPSGFIGKPSQAQL